VDPAFVCCEVQRYKLDVIETPEANVEPGGARRRPCQRLEKPEQLGAVFGAFGKYFADAGALWDRPFDASFG